MASNLENATRTLVEKTWRSMVTYQIPLFTRLMERKQILPGGTYLEQLYESALMEDLVEVYGPNDQLGAGSKEIMRKPAWRIAYMHLSLTEGVDEEVMNAPMTDARLIKIRDKVASNAVKSLVRQAAKYAYGCAGDQDVDTLHTTPQGIFSALKASVTYGGIANGTYTEWAAADYANNSTAYSINKSNLDAWLDAVDEYNDEPGTYLILMGPTLYRRLKAQFEASNSYTPKASMSKQGFESMEYNGIEIAKDPLLDRMTSTTVRNRAGTGIGLDGSVAGTAVVAILNLNTWHLRYHHKAGAKKMGPFEFDGWHDQSKIVGGREQSLARLKWRWNLTCDAPNRNLVRLAVS